MSGMSVLEWMLSHRPNKEAAPSKKSVSKCWLNFNFIEIVCLFLTLCNMERNNANSVKLRSKLIDVCETDLKSSMRRIVRKSNFVIFIFITNSRACTHTIHTYTRISYTSYIHNIHTEYICDEILHAGHAVCELT